MSLFEPRFWGTDPVVVRFFYVISPTRSLGGVLVRVCKLGFGALKRPTGSSQYSQGTHTDAAWASTARSGHAHLSALARYRLCQINCARRLILQGYKKSTSLPANGRSRVLSLFSPLTEEICLIRQLRSDSASSRKWRSLTLESAKITGSKRIIKNLN